MGKRGLLFILGGIASLTLISGVILSSVSVKAEGNSASASVTVPPSHCTMETDVSNDVPHTATINNGTYKEDIGTTTFKVFCGDTGGYSVYAVGYSNDEQGNTKLLATVGGSLSPANDIVTGTATSGDSSNWAVKATPVSGTYAPTIENGFNNYNLIPTDYTKIATFPSLTDTSVGSSFATTYRAYISKSQPAGTYSGKVRYTLVHPASEVPLSPQETAAGKIGYFPNASGVVDSMGDQDASANSEVVLWASNFKRSGYGFAGWNTEYDYSGTTYGPNETITTPSDLATKGLSLYAVWVKSAGNLQGWTGCSALNIGDVTALTDTRDNDTYAVAKLADGKCWMIENLRLDNTNSDNPTGALAQGYNTSTFKGLADPEAPWANESTTANSLYSTDGSNSTFAITGSNQGYRFPRYNNSNTSDTVANMTGANQNIYSYGNYYTWAAAIADTTNYTTNNQSVTSTSICPSGWRLPQGGNKTRIESNNDNDFWTLVVTNLNNGTNPDNYSSQTYPYYTGSAEVGPVEAKLRSYPNNFIRSGYVSSSSVINRGSLGNFWSSTAFSSYYAYTLDFSSSGVYPGTGYNAKYGGRPVRCVSGFGVGS